MCFIMCAHIYLKNVIISIKGLRFYYYYGWKYVQDNCKGDLKFCFKTEKGKVFQRIINMVCSTYMHC